MQTENGMGNEARIPPPQEMRQSTLEGKYTKTESTLKNTQAGHPSKHARSRIEYCDETEQSH